jgi:hypothetical protein
VSIFDDNNPQTPLVIYMPRIVDADLLKATTDNSLVQLTQENSLLGFNVDNCVNSDYCSTFNFKYADKQARQLSALMEFNVRANRQKIVQAIRNKINQMGK